MNRTQSIFKALSLLLALVLAATLLPLGAAAAKPHFDSVCGATSGGGHDDDDDDDDTPASFGNDPVDPAGYTFTAYSPAGVTGTALAKLMDSTPIFYYNGSSYRQLMYYCMKGYAYMFYLYGNSYSEYVGISYGYEDEIEVKDASV